VHFFQIVADISSPEFEPLNAWL